MKTDDKYIKFDDVSKAISDFIDYDDEQQTGLSESEAEKYSYASDQLTDLYDYIDETLEKVEINDKPAVHGKWITINAVTRCSNCEYIPPYDRAIDDIYCSSFCPECGARMDGESDE